MVKSINTSAFENFCGSPVVTQFILAFYLSHLEVVQPSFSPILLLSHVPPFKYLSLQIPPVGQDILVLKND